MSKEKRSVPKLRFPGFTEDWEQRKLEDVCNVYDGTHQTPRYTNSGVMFVSVEDIETLESNKYITEEDFKSEFKVFPEYGDILLTRIGDVGSANVILDEIKRAYYVSLALLKPKDINSLFLLALLSSSSVQSEIWRRTLHIAFPKKINKNEINKVIVNQPSIPEQKKIGKLFFSLDQTITLHQRKLEHLKLKKKALLQKLFPKNGERYPELRFPGFTDAWEQCKLSDILVERNEQQVETNEYPLMSFVQGYGVIPKGERYDRSFLVLDQSKKYKRTELGDFIYSSNNLETGSIGINKTGKAVISPVYSIFYGVSIGDSQFIGIMSLLPRFIAKMIRFRQGVVYGQWRIHEKDFLDISILIPSVDERTKITKLILSLEELITLHQRKFDHLQLQKKALLQQMFV